MSFTISYPYDTKTSSVVLRSPEYGDIDRTELGTVLNTIRSGEQRAVNLAGVTRENRQRYVYKFVLVNASVVSDFVDILFSSAANLVNIVDHDGTDFNGIIISDPVEVVTARDDGRYEVSFEVLVVS